MPIKTDSEVWEDTDAGPTAMERIVQFLEKNRGKAFTAMEIHEYAFDVETPSAEEDYASYSAIITQMTVHLANLTYLGDVEGRVLPNSELDNEHEDGNTAYYTAAGDGEVEGEGEDENDEDE